MKIRNKKNCEKGFTIVELMIATAVFSFVLLVTSAGVIAIGRAYYKSLTYNRVQDTSRSVMDDVSRSLQFSKTDSVSSLLTNIDGTPATIKVRCFGPDRYRYVIDQQITGPVVGTSNIGLYRDKRPSESTCDTSGAYSGGAEMLGTNMRLLQFDVSDSNPFDVKIRVAYGDNDLLTNYPDNASATTPPIAGVDPATVLCKSGLAGNQFCAVSALETTVTSRVE